MPWALSSLRISPDKIYIDIAASGSPFVDILNSRGIKPYRLDLAYPAAVHGTNIGADAGATYLPAGFATVLSAQCAYECFMGDADIRFIQESERILRSSGRYAIIPCIWKRHALLQPVRIVTRRM